MNKIYNDDCFNIFPKLLENIKKNEMKKIDLVCVDLPYGQTDLEWDKKIDLKKMWKALKQICWISEF